MRLSKARAGRTFEYLVQELRAGKTLQVVKCECDLGPEPKRVDEGRLIWMDGQDIKVTLIGDNTRLSGAKYDSPEDAVEFWLKRHILEVYEAESYAVAALKVGKKLKPLTCGCTDQVCLNSRFWMEGALMWMHHRGENIPLTHLTPHYVVRNMLHTGHELGIA
jgi:hypothetical protein